MKKFTDSIRKFFTPYKWETIWTCNATSHASTGFGFVYVGKINVKVILQVDHYKGTYRCYMTEGTMREPLDLNILTDTYPQLPSLLKMYGIEC